jgi:ABC-2 type transport system permease protein
MKLSALRAYTVLRALQFSPLVIPPLLTAKNYLRATAQTRLGVIKISSYALFFILLASLFARGAYDTCIRLNEFSSLATQLALDILIAATALIVGLGTFITALNTLFLSHDTDLILASPLSPWRFFIGRFLRSWSSSLWMVILFIVPGFAGVLYVSEATVSGMILFALSAMSIVTIASSLAFAGASLGSLFRILYRLRVLFIALFGFMLVALFAAARFLVMELRSSPRAVFEALAPYTGKNFNPCAWPARYIVESQPPLLLAIVLIGTAAFSIGLSYLLFRSVYCRAPGLIHTSMRAQTRSTVRLSRLALVVVPPQLRIGLSFACKEYKLFLRDLIHTAQLITLLTLCIIYLYNFQLFDGEVVLPHELRPWWDMLLVVINLILAGVVIATVCTRFVYPSLSLEGRAFWILESAPLGIEELLTIKQWLWFIPIGGLSAIITTSGGWAIGADPFTIALTAVASMILSYGICGVCIGLGAHFLTLDWEHPAQITSGFGGISAMLASCAVVGLSAIPIGILLTLRVLRALFPIFEHPLWYGALVLVTAIFVAINVGASRWALRLGGATLMKRRY